MRTESQPESTSQARRLSAGLGWALAGLLCSCAALAEDTDAASCAPPHPSPERSSDRRIDRPLFERYEGYKIGSIAIESRDIFNESNPRENNWLYRAANRIQVNTREPVIRSQLLFEEGDTLDLDKVEESIRILYGREYLLNVKIEIAQVCDQSVDLLVIARDAWVIEPRINYGLEGGETTSGIGLRDGNFFGSGNALELIYQSTPERSKIIYRFTSENFLNRRLNAEFYHADLSDGSNRTIAIEKPFFSIDSERAYGVSTELEHIKETTRVRSEEVNRYDHKTQHDTIYIGQALQHNRTLARRLVMGLEREHHQFAPVESTVDLPSPMEQQFLYFGYQQDTNKYREFRNLDQIKRAEDIAIGTQFEARYGIGTWENAEQLNKVEAELSTVLSLSDKHLYRLGAELEWNQYADTRETRGSSVSLAASYYHFITSHHRWYFAAQYDMGWSLDEYEEFELGEANNLRGYPISFQRGDQRYTLNIERRYYSDIHWFNLIRVGAAVFVDAGRAWSDLYPDNPVLASAGLGLRFQASKTGNPMVLHVNIAKPLIDTEGIDDALLSITMQDRF